MGQFQPGVSGNPAGRPKGSAGGRIQALAALDEMLAKKKNRKTLVQALEKDFLGNPVRFFKSIVMPLLPREAKLSFDHEGVVAWRSLLDGSGRENQALESGPVEPLALEKSYALAEPEPSTTGR
jgi:hypothetical protein